MIPRKNSPVSIGSVLDSLLDSEQLREFKLQRKLEDNWEKIIGSRIAEMAKIVDCHPPILKMKVSQPTWKMELKLKSHELLGNINKFLGNTIFKEIEFA